MNRNRMLYVHWLRSLCVGDSTIVTGNLILTSPLFREPSRLVCLLKGKSLGIVCEVEKVNELCVKVAGKYFRLDSGVCSPGSSRYRLQIYPPFNINEEAVKELIINTRRG